MPKSHLDAAVAVATRVPVSIDRGSAGPVSCELVSFINLPDEKEHLALVFAGADDGTESFIVRLHSECLTGDVFGSRRCDCGPQLTETVELLAERGGVLLYLRQEGRGIGLYNKLAAYGLQDSGLDTFAANEALGFGTDDRDYTVAAQMLGALGIARLTLLTNNPAKAAGLRAAGIAVVEIENTRTYLNPHNARYLRSKARAGHLLQEDMIDD